METKLEVRPKVELVVQHSPEEVIARIKAAIEENRTACRGTVLGSTIEVGVPPDERHFWSPQFSLQVEPHEDGAIIFGRIGPQPHVWTMLVAGYAIFGFSSLFALFFAYSQWRLAQPMWALWVVAAGVALTGVIYGTARIGQRLGADQTDHLCHFIRDTLVASTETERVAA